ncbi:MAG TPA: ADP-ribose pyrophosphatase [Desulfotomaculum sp.]|nr:ADP-ribose pyrophosphatase [Desulfotomaculum sp.]HBY04917.1 ADP-ribose pyrophosphatase [Desulfotomaculum sp.]
MSSEKVLSSDLVYKGKIINLKVDRVELSEGRSAVREVVEHDGAVAVVAVDSAENVLLVRQYRYPAGKELLEIPAGMVEQDEDPLSGAKRELAEETGARASSWQYLFGFYSSPGFCDEYLRVYLARELEFASQDLDEDESIELVKIPLGRVPEEIERGAIQDAKSIAGLLGAFRLLSKSTG